MSFINWILFLSVWYGEICFLNYSEFYLFQHLLKSVWCNLIYIVNSVINQNNTHTIHCFSFFCLKMNNFCEKFFCNKKQKNGLITGLRYKFKLCLFSLHKNVHYHRFSIVTAPWHVAIDQVTIPSARTTSYPSLKLIALRFCTLSCFLICQIQVIGSAAYWYINYSDSLLQLWNLLISVALRLISLVVTR